MSGDLRKAGVIAVVTLLEVLRSRLLLASFFFAVVLVALSVAAASVSFAEQSRLIIDVGLTAVSGLGSLIALIITISAFANELSSRTAYTFLARPLPRWAFVLGKYVGVVMAMELVVILMGTATAVVVWIYGDPVPAAFWASMWLACIEVFVVVAIAMLFSTLAVPAFAAAYSVSVLLVGNLASDILVFAMRMESKGYWLGTVIHWIYYLPPDLEKLSLRAYAANNLPVPTQQLFMGTGYGLMYAASAVILAMLIFARRKSV